MKPTIDIPPLDASKFHLPELKSTGMVDPLTIDRMEYEYLRKCERYVAEWGVNVQTCPKCGELYPMGCICNCGHTDKTP